MHVLPKEARRWHQIPWNGSCGQLLATMWVLGSKPGSSSKIASALNCWTSLQPQIKINPKEKKLTKYLKGIQLIKTNLKKSKAGALTISDFLSTPETEASKSPGVQGQSDVQ